MQYEIREVIESDYLGICNLFNNELGFSNVTLDDLSRRINKMKADTNYHILVALHNNNVVGFVATCKGMLFEMENEYLRVIGLSVTVKYRRKKIGSMLLKKIRRICTC